MKKKYVALAVGLLLVTVLGVGGSVLALSDEGQYYLGKGDYAPSEKEKSTATVVVSSGDTGTDIAYELEERGVIKNYYTFVQKSKENPLSSSISPGSYVLSKKITSRQALESLLDTPDADTVTIPEGLTNKKVFALLNKETQIPVKNFEETNPPEGLLYPSTYNFGPEPTAQSIVTMMQNQNAAVLSSLGVPPEKAYEVLTRASLIQAESGNVEDMYKVSRVIQNRLDDDMPLQFDTTVNYATDKEDLTTTDEQRSSTSLYNTYVHKGLPPGPISNPGEDAIKAALNPADGPWVYFVVIDPDTGETAFSTTFEEHQKNVLIFQKWLRNNS